jgi:protease-4
MDDVAARGSEERPPSFPEHPSQYPTTPRKWYERENKRLKTALAVASVAVFVLLLLVVTLLLGTAGAGLALPARGLRHELVRDGDPAATIAVVPVSGFIFAGDSGSGPRTGTADWVVRALRAAGDDPAVRAVILEVDSPGGSITGADLIHREVGRLKEKGAKVVALLQGVAASGGYYVSAGADRIVAYPTAITGSIGTILQTVSVEGLMEKLGVEAVTIKTGEFKDTGSPFRSPTEKDIAVLQAIADEAHDRFVSVVAEGRGMPADEARAVADGRILSARQAVDAGLVDELGHLEEAVAAAEKAAGVTGATVVRYGRTPSLLDVLFMDTKLGDPAAALARLLSRVGPLYLAENLPEGGYVLGTATGR